MKKSTLITTIAMIVVVVVALSTATYAWFTSATATYANLDLSVDAAENLTVLVNSTPIYSTTDTATFDAQNFLTQPAATADNIRDGVWAPNQITAIDIKPNNDVTANTTLYTSQTAVSFVSGTLDVTTGKLTGVKAAVMSPDIVNITNNTDDEKHVILTIIIGFANDAPSKYAAAGVCAYVAGTDGLLAETDYYYKNTAPWASGDIANASTAFSLHDASEQVSAKVFVDSTTNQNHSTSISTTVAPSASGDDDQKLAADAQIGTDYFYTLKADLGVLAQNSSANYLVYTWLDGGFLGNNARGSTIKIVYAFTPSDSALS